jgi:prepilin-type N-terminal cleavage/methylation domain-containing protein
MRKLRASFDRPAFTLIELMVVIVILGLLTAIASLSLGGVMDRYQLSRAAETIEAFDGRVRRSARLSREALDAVIRRGNRDLIVKIPSQRTGNAEANYRLPRSVEINDVKLRDQAVTARDVTLHFNDQGRSASYAIQLRRGNSIRWLVVLGISGQVIPVASEEEADALLSL